ncbi:hypothetical protein HGG78_18110 [Vibrio aestuarianus]|uniref:hypothetical protein n=1 Tax=Vibrio aestuarianus TaxID=28171 RepID=UPI0015594AB9|nr:hypothetical protein [Vibrio aestuarianus]NGZ15632.1 hypothetical protein [Vibrio aestuarianus]NKZ51780.1 hypothetical protein [Vibrio aestuarianus]
MNLKSISLAVSTLLICSSAFSATLEFRVGDVDQDQLFHSFIPGVSGHAIEANQTITTEMPTNGFTLSPMEFNESYNYGAGQNFDTAGLATVLSNYNRDKLLVICNLEPAERNKMTFQFYDAIDTKLASLTCKPGDAPKRRAVTLSEVEKLIIKYQ